MKINYKGGGHVAPVPIVPASGHDINSCTDHTHNHHGGS